MWVTKSDADRESIFKSLNKEGKVSSVSVTWEIIIRLDVVLHSEQIIHNLKKKTFFQIALFEKRGKETLHLFWSKLEIFQAFDLVIAMKMFGVIMSNVSVLI